MATSLDDDLEFNNQDYYSLLNVRREVWFMLLHGGTGRSAKPFCFDSFRRCPWRKSSAVGASSPQLNNGLQQQSHRCALIPADDAQQEFRI